ncbi:RidA family protein [Amycolatopsis jejuensis]|uniref:RidA family protein n=1 Tax=Amycolatopsis jejuensis TaxID=330084 RepID=UPI000525C703|nr:RidA family protein [Amycolatopsis jejuensis]
MSAVEYLNPAGLHRIPGALTACVVVRSAGLVFLSGQVAWDEHGALIGDDHFAQMRQIVRNLDLALAAAGSGRDLIVKETVYVVDHQPELLPGLLVPLRTSGAEPPASTLAGVSALFAPGVLVEVDVVAALR